MATNETNTPILGLDGDQVKGQFNQTFAVVSVHKEAPIRLPVFSFSNSYAGYIVLLESFQFVY